MAEKTFTNVRLGLKVDTLENWGKSSLVLKKGEVAFATVAASAGTGLSEPVVMMKIGDGEHTFGQLGFDFYAKASDVLAACKTTEDLTAFVNGVIANAGIATNSAMQELAGKVTTAEGEIDTLQSEMDAVEAKAAANETAIEAIEAKFGAETVSEEIATAIAALKLSDTYAAKTHGHEIADVNGLSDSIAAAKKAGDDAAAALSTYKTTNDAAVKVNSDAITAIKDGATIDSFADVEAALAGKQAAGNYSVVGHKHEIADVNGLSDAIADAKKAGTDAATAAGNALTDAKAYTDAEIDEWVGDKNVGTQISEAIANYTTTADMNTAIATAKGEANTYADGLNTAMDTRVKAVEGKAHTHTFVESELNLIQAGDVAKWNAAEGNAKTYADGLNTAMDERVDALEAKFTGEDSVADQIAAAVAAEAELREAADADLQGQIGTASVDGGAAATGLHARIEELEDLVGDTKVSEAIATAVKAEEDRAKGIESDLEERLAAVEGDYLKAADKTELEGKIKSNADAIELLTNGVDSETVDGVNDLIQYVKDHGTEVTGIKEDIKTNADDIDALEGRMTTAEGAIAAKAAQTDLEAAVTRIGTAEGKIATLEGEMDTSQADIDALELKVGDKAVSEQITDVTNPLAERVEALEAVDHEHANAAELDKIAEGDKAKWDAAVQTVTAGTGLTATKTGTDVAIAFDDSVTFIFDCGGADVAAE